MFPFSPLLATMKMLKEGQSADDQEVTWEDQKHINQFAKLNNKLTEFEELEERAKQEKEYVDDAVMEMELMDDDDRMPYRLGDCFIHVSTEEARELAVKAQEEFGKEVSDLGDNMKAVRQEMDSLRSQLYAKFGDSINLERD
jgi:prefoldin subunit 4